MSWTPDEPVVLRIGKGEFRAHQRWEVYRDGQHGILLTVRMAYPWADRQAASQYASRLREEVRRSYGGLARPQSGPLIRVEVVTRSAAAADQVIAEPVPGGPPPSVDAISVLGLPADADALVSALPASAPGPDARWSFSGRSVRGHQAAVDFALDRLYRPAGHLAGYLQSSNLRQPRDNTAPSAWVELERRRKEAFRQVVSSFTDSARDTLRALVEPPAGRPALLPAGWDMRDIIGAADTIIRMPERQNAAPFVRRDGSSVVSGNIPDTSVRLRIIRSRDGTVVQVIVFDDSPVSGAAHRA